MTLEGEPLTDEEIATLLAGTETLVLLRGQWVEIDRRVWNARCAASRRRRTSPSGRG